MKTYITEQEVLQASRRFEKGYETADAIAHDLGWEIKNKVIYDAEMQEYVMIDSLLDIIWQLLDAKAEHMATVTAYDYIRKFGIFQS